MRKGAEREEKLRRDALSRGLGINVVCSMLLKFIFYLWKFKNKFNSLCLDFQPFFHSIPEIKQKKESKRFCSAARELGTPYRVWE